MTGLAVTALVPVVEFTLSGGRRTRRSLVDCADERFEDALPSRRAARYAGQSNTIGEAWVETVARHVAFESGVERDWLLFDFDRAFVGVAAQPFKLTYPAADGSLVTQFPDMFARRADGSAVVVSCKPSERVEAHVGRFAEMSEVFATVGWSHEVFTGLGRVHAANLRWLSRFRRPLPSSYAGDVRRVVAAAEPGGVRFESLVRAASNEPVGVAVAAHLLWAGRLVADRGFTESVLRQWSPISLKETR